MTAVATAGGTRVHEVILASAGSGKTWQLTTRFLALLADGVAPEAILATTFTRKAAGEIFTRLLERLARAATDEQALGELNRDLGRPFDRALDRAGCRALLGRTARALDRFQVRTLDACFAELAGLFGLDLGLPPGWELVEEVDDRALRSEAVGAALAGAPATELATLLYGLHGDRPRRSVHERLLQAVYDGYGIWLESEDAAWECAIRLPAALSPEEIAALPERVAALQPPLTKTGKPNANVLKAIAGLLGHIERQDWTAVLDAGPVPCAFDGKGSYYGMPLDENWLATLRVVGRHAGRALATRLLQRSRAQRRLLARFDVEYRRLQRERRAFRFDDLPRALARGVLDLGSAGAALRLGRSVEHLLLDEFQDTSVLQWRVFKPLARAIWRQPADVRSFFCVGDTKQAIYAWREGESRLLQKLADGRCDGQAVTRTLSASYRSSRAVLELVNRVFEGLATNPVFDEKPVFARVASSWAQRFEAHEPATGRPVRPGAARLIEVPMSGEAPSREERTDQLMTAAACHVQALTQQAPGQKIAVLLRRGAPAARLLYELAALGVPASGEGGNALTDADSVRLALSLLQLADHPGDSAALFHLATSPIAAALGLAPAACTDDAAVRALGRRVRAELAERGYGEWLADIERNVLASSAFDAWERGRFRQLVELGLRWDALSAARAGAFVEHVRLTRVEDPSAARVRVMTVHAAKGLEFDAVVLPDLEDELKGRDAELVALRPDPEGPITTVFPRPSEQLCLVIDELRAGCEAAHERALEEALCVLYVALTRAKRRLDVLVPAQVKGMHTATFARLLRHALLGADAFPAADECGVLWNAPSGVDEWYAPVAPVVPSWLAVAPPAASPTAPPVLAWSPSAPRTLSRRSPSRLEGGACVAVAELLSLEGGAARGRGVLVHRWLEELEWLEDLPVVDDALLAAGAEVAREGGLTLTDQHVALAELRLWLSRPATRALFEWQAARQRLGLGAEATLSVQRERRFAVPDERGLLVGSMDRVVLATRGGVPVAAEIVDYKTDRIDAGSRGAAALDATVERYRPQMQAYRRALSALTGLAPERIACRLLFLERDLVREV